MSHPLLSWDILQEGIYRRETFKKDMDNLQQIRKQNKWSSLSVQWDTPLIWESKVVIITDPKLTILYVTENMIAMNGYCLDDIIGKTPRIFQGPETTDDEKMVIREAIKLQQPFTTVITNYRKDRSIYKCRVEGYPVFNNEKELVNFIAFENVA